MKKTIRLTESNFIKIVKRIIKESDEDLSMKEKLDDIFFGHDSSNIFTPSGELGYLSQERRLRKKITPKGRKKRIQHVIDELESYIEYLKNEKLGEEDTWINNPEYGNIWGDQDN